MKLIKEDEWNVWQRTWFFCSYERRTSGEILRLLVCSRYINFFGIGRSYRRYVQISGDVRCATVDLKYRFICIILSKRDLGVGEGLGTATVVMIPCIGVTIILLRLNLFSTNICRMLLSCPAYVQLARTIMVTDTYLAGRFYSSSETSTFCSMPGPTVLT